MSDLEVVGGLGGLEVAVEDLRRAAAGLRRCAAVLDDWLGPNWEVAPWLSLHVPPVPPALPLLSAVTVQVTRARAESGELRRWVASTAVRLRDLADATARAADGFEAVEARNRALVGAVHDQAMVVARIVTAATGRAFGLLDEGTGWEVAVTAARTRDGVVVPVPTSAETLLAGVESLAVEGRVRVVEVPTADGSTTWVVQVPGTHGSWFEGGSVPMDWPANVSLMLAATSASAVAATTALDRAQAGRARPGDRVVLVGHSQGGLVAAALASDPAFGRRHRVTHVVTAGSPIDEFPIPASIDVLSLQHRGDPVHALDVSPPPDRRTWTTVVATPAARSLPNGGPVAAHALGAYRSTAAAVDRSDDVSLQRWRAGVAPALTSRTGSVPVVHEFRSERRWHNRDS
ncbi:PGAP1-like alpha/beta domain-containing protein [Knoellia aerolata]|uniref:GPI inositol-deacylase PGAP1-like alpha/beta domain-containing protein n=1 Tax=Knoellia aerolata DSM 18566 TaxID=1385519 RepID=A0A0A0K283_9MICO|nr:alpha/beta hydrolase [Knoellia aerolata]KGN43124.1 hypothetical protein N801_04870 [Knoellia aerolata DSM 18566]